MKCVIIQPPLVQLNTAYPSGAYLKAFFSQQGLDAKWIDLSVGLFHEIFCEEGLTKLFELTQNKAIEIAQRAQSSGDDVTYSNIISYVSQSFSWCSWIDSIVKILTQDKNQSSRELCHRFIFSPDSPRGSRMNSYLENLDHDLTVDDARFLASLALVDLADYIQFVYDKEFSLIRYGESIAVDSRSFEQIEAHVESPVLKDFYEPLLKKKFGELNLNAEENFLVCISVPFPGTFNAALFTGSYLKKEFGSKAFVVMGGGFINTELRNCTEKNLYKYVDAFSYDRGYGSYKKLLELGISSLRDMTCPGNEFGGIYKLALYSKEKIIAALEKDSECEEFEKEQTKTLVPDFSDIDFSVYPRMVDDTNPMQRMWSDGTWLKVYLAHGCYWHKCAFCDVTLDYVKSYELTKIEPLYKSLIEQSKKNGIRGIHFVDEAMPPRAIKEFALLNIQNKNHFSFWGNIRFEKVYSRDLVELASYGGLIGVSGGIEIATGSGLDAISKGTDIDSIVAACCAFKECGVLIHAYMIFGYFSQTETDLMNSMETLRQMYQAGLLDSCFWHKFMLTRHSRIYEEWQQGKYPELKPVEDSHSGIFAKNGLHFEGEKKSEKYSRGLNAALNSWMHGQKLNMNISKWFDFPVVQPTIPKNYIETAIQKYESQRDAQFNAPIIPEKLFWTGGKIIPLVKEKIISWTYNNELIEEKFNLKNVSMESFIQALEDLRPQIHNPEKMQQLLKVPGVESFVKKLRGSGVIMI